MIHTDHLPTLLIGHRMLRYWRTRAFDYLSTRDVIDVIEIPCCQPTPRAERSAHPWVWCGVVFSAAVGPWVGCTRTCIVYRRWPATEPVRSAKTTQRPLTTLSIPMK